MSVSNVWSPKRPNRLHSQPNARSLRSKTRCHQGQTEKKFEIYKRLNFKMPEWRSNEVGETVQSLRCCWAKAFEQCVFILKGSSKALEANISKNRANSFFQAKRVEASAVLLRFSLVFCLFYSFICDRNSQSNAIVSLGLVPCGPFFRGQCSGHSVIHTAKHLIFIFLPDLSGLLELLPFGNL